MNDSTNLGKAFLAFKQILLKGSCKKCGDSFYSRHDYCEFCLDLCASCCDQHDSNNPDCEDMFDFIDDLLSGQHQELGVFQNARNALTSFCGCKVRISGNIEDCTLPVRSTCIECHGCTNCCSCKCKQCYENQVDCFLCHSCTDCCGHDKTPCSFCNKDDQCECKYNK